MNLALREYQAEIVDAIEAKARPRIIGLKARQIGWTTIAVANSLHDVLFNDWLPWLFVSRDEGAAQAMVDMATIGYGRLPRWMRDMLPQPESITQSLIQFSNGSRIKAEPATQKAGRGGASYGVLMDECAFMEYADEIFAAVEPQTYGPLMLFSTANGMGNFFHDIWLDSQRDGSAWQGIFYPWHVVPERDDAWYEDKRLQHRIRPWFFYQEFPSSPEEAFAKSGRVAFAQDVLGEAFEEVVPEAAYAWSLEGEARELPVERWGTDDIEIVVYKKPLVREDENGRLIMKPNYVLGADVAEGLEHGDWSYITVFDTYNNEQVAKCKTHIPVYYLAGLIHWLAKYYHGALVAIERNNAGIMPIDVLANDFWYNRLYRMDRFAQMIGSGERDQRFGWQTTKQSKPKMVLDFQEALAMGAMTLHDRELLVEAQTFVADGKGSYGASEGNHDDVVMGTLVAWQGVLDSPSYPVFWDDHKVRPLTMGEWEDHVFTEPKPENPLNDWLGREPSPRGRRKLFITK